ncbi:MAG: hypothetical protein IJH86_06720 [Clostridia bacterium]|nr:hypothetical protein [Clostridia bacterium]
MRRITRDDLRGLYAPVPQSLRDGVHAALAPLPEGKERIVKKKISISILLAAALAVMGVTALAVSQLNLFRQTAEQPHPIVPLDGADKLVVTHLGQTENAHVVLTVEEAVYDGQGVMALIRLTPKDIGHNAMYDPYLQDAPDDVYEKASVNKRVYWGSFIADPERGGEILVVNERDRRELWVGDKQVAIPASAEAARSADLPVYMDGDVMRSANEQGMEVTSRRDGRRMIDYRLTLSLAGAGASQLDELLAEARRAEGQADGSALVWFNGYGAKPLTGSLEMALSGETTLNGETVKLDGLTFALTPVETERRYRLIPEVDEVPGAYRIKSATINLSRVRGYFTIEYDMLSDDPYHTVSFRVLDREGRPINDGMGWMERGDDACAEQYELQSFDASSDTLTLLVVDENGDTLGQCVCRVVEEE